MDKEIWRDITGYEGLYQISNKGNVMSFKRPGSWKNRIMKIFIGESGYSSVGLRKNQKTKTNLIHRLVAETFIENLENKPCVNHKNGIRDDNCVKNLEWCTVSENNLHSYRVLERSCFFKTNNPSKGKFGKESKSSIKVNQFTKLGELIKTWDSMADIQRKLGIEQSNITKCCRGRTRSLGGFIWKYV